MFYLCKVSCKAFFSRLHFTEDLLDLFLLLQGESYFLVVVHTLQCMCDCSLVFCRREVFHCYPIFLLHAVTAVVWSSLIVLRKKKFPKQTNKNNPQVSGWGKSSTSLLGINARISIYLQHHRHFSVF